MSPDAFPQRRHAGEVEHPAVVAWRRAAGKPEAAFRIETLKQRRKTEVYRLHPAAGGNMTIIAKLSRSCHARRELSLYQDVLNKLPVRSPLHLGILEVPGGDFSWQFFEDGGERLVESRAEQRALAQWLAHLHVAACELLPRPEVRERKADLYRNHLRSALTNVRAAAQTDSIEDGQALRRIGERCRVLEERWTVIARAATSDRTTLVHGDLVAKNVRLKASAAGPPDVFVFDWELAGWGTPAPDIAQVDLASYAAVVRGAWSEADPEWLQTMKTVGTLFRLIAALNWKSWKLQDRRSAEYFADLVEKAESLAARLSASAPRDAARHLPMSQGSCGAAPGTAVNQVLVTRAAEALRACGVCDQTTQITDLRRHPLSSTHDAFLATLRRAHGQTLEVFCKYGRRNNDAPSHGHRGGVAREIAVYQRVLEPLGSSAPRCYGSYRAPDGEGDWLVLEGLPECRKVSLGSLADLCEAARWAARFHVATADAALPADAGVFRYDRAYYEGWLHRTIEFASRSQPPRPWLHRLQSTYRRLVDELLEAPQSVVHGEYFPANIQLCDGKIRPVDWESAAVAPGELDLATLTDSWPEEVQQACVRAYRDERWPEVPDPNFERRLDQARLYLCFRWLGDEREWDKWGVERRFDEALHVAGRLELLDHEPEPARPVAGRTE